MKFQNQLVTFAEGNKDFYALVKDYFAEYTARKTGNQTINFSKEISFEEKGRTLHEEYRKEISRKTGMDIEKFSAAELTTNPLVSWATFAIAGVLVDMILPETLIQSIGIYSEIHTIGYGDSASIRIKPRDLFVVSKAGRAKRQGELKRQFEGQVNIVPENHQVSVYVDLYRVLAGLESLADFLAKCIQSIETEVTLEAYSAFSTALGALATTGDETLKIAGYSADSLVTLGQKVTAYNGGAKAVIVGTKLALSKVLPANTNFRYFLDSDYVKVGYLRDFMGFEVIEMPQVANWKAPFTLALKDNELYIVSPSANKLVHVALGGDTLSYASGPFDNANLIQVGTLYKQWGTAIATNSIAGLITLG